MPIAFASMSIQNNKDYIKSIGVLALPTVQMYKRGKLVDNFPCGPSKVPILKTKLADLIAKSVDPETLLLRPSSRGPDADLDTAAAEPTFPLPQDAPTMEKPAQTAATTKDLPDMADGVAIDRPQFLTDAQIERMRSTVPFFSPLSDKDYQVALREAKILTFDKGAVLMREGNFGRTFYYMLEGEVEICQKTAFEDPLIAPVDYIGTVINRLTAGDYFGERALLTGEPRGASIRVSENMRCVAFKKEDLPVACVLSGSPSQIANSTMVGPDGEQTDIVESVNEKYGVSMLKFYDIETDRQIKESNLENQQRGSALTPRPIRGVDTDVDTDDESDIDEEEAAEDASLAMLKERTAAIIPLLEKFKLIRLISRCFDYIVANQAKWGQPAVRRRRSLLVSRLARSQREEIVEAFKLVDVDGDGGISMLELKRVMESIGEEKSTEDLMELIPSGYQSGARGEGVMNLEDFMGIMAEAEFYFLFRDIFAALDTRGDGFVKAGDLDRVLSGVRDLISDDKHSIIDVDDLDMAIDYEQFTKMLLGLSL